MDLDGARNAKAEIFRGSFGFVESPGGASSGLPTFISPDAGDRLGSLTRSIGGFYADRDGPARSRFAAHPDFDTLGALELSNAMKAIPPEPEVPPAIAVGIQALRGKTTSSRLILFGSGKKMRDHPMVEKALAVAKGEAVFVDGGLNRPLSCWQPPRRRPLAAGISVAHFQVSAGTLGAFVVQGDGTLAILSNNHVLANVNRAAIGDEILQPGKLDTGGRPADIVATLSKFIAIDTSAGAANMVDCALATLVPGQEVVADFMEQAEGLPLRVTGVSSGEVFAGDGVTKVGRTSGRTIGEVFATEVDNYVLNMGTSSKPIRCRFDDQIQIYSEAGHFARDGDSGSLVIGRDGAALGLLFAGSSKGAPSGFGLAAANPVAAALQRLDATLWTG